MSGLRYTMNILVLFEQRGLHWRAVVEMPDKTAGYIHMHRRIYKYGRPYLVSVFDEQRRREFYRLYRFLESRKKAGLFVHAMGDYTYYYVQIKRWLLSYRRGQLITLGLKVPIARIEQEFGPMALAHVPQATVEVVRGS